MPPKPLGHYSQIVRAGDLFFLSGQISINPATNEICLFDGDAAKQAELILKNIEAILADKTLQKEAIVKMTLYLTDISQSAQVNGVYSQFLGSHKPARTTVEVSDLPRGVAIEIEAVACLAP